MGQNKDSWTLVVLYCRRVAYHYDISLVCFYVCREVGVVYFRFSTCTGPYMKHLEASCTLIHTVTYFCRRASLKAQNDNFTQCSFEGEQLLFIY